MWTDLLAAALAFAPWGVLAGLCFLLAGLIGVIVFRRRDLTVDDRDLVIGEYVVKPYIPEASIVPAMPVAPNYHRPDADTHVIPGIPGATPPLSPQLAAVARYLDDVDQAADETVEIVTAFDQIEGLRVIPSAGPVCPVCGGPWHAVCPSAPKAADEQLVDDCPLTTQDLVIPTYGDTPVHREIADREPTQELSGRVAKILEGSK